MQNVMTIRTNVSILVICRALLATTFETYYNICFATQYGPTASLAIIREDRMFIPLSTSYAKNRRSPRRVLSDL